MSKWGMVIDLNKCTGCGSCVNACRMENNIPVVGADAAQEGRTMDWMQIITEYDGEFPNVRITHIPRPCFQCGDPPCVKVCPVHATFVNEDGLVGQVYYRCIGCRYCMAACPYWGRRFNWHDPHIPKEEITTKQHYLGNRIRQRGVMEKCTFCIQRSREGKLPACADACPTGSRVFGNLLDPNSEIRFVLKNKKVFRMKEDLGTDPKFWYFMD